MKKNLVISLIVAFTIALNLTASDEKCPIGQVAGDLVDAKGKTVELKSTPYVLFYFSAHWCPPCRKFTPELVKFYNANGGGKEFEIIFVSSDRSEKDMYAYMEETHMPWPTLKFDKIEDAVVKDSAGKYIPSLVMFDREGQLVAGTYDFENDEYIGPQSVLDALSKKL